MAYEVGQLSPDGMWIWDGGRWIQVQRPGMRAPRRSRTWLWWVAGGCAVLLVLGVGAGIWGAVSLAHAVQQGSLSCMPSDFPRYPGATVTRDYTYFGTGVAPGDSRECQESLSSDDGVATVSAFYTSQLNSGDWQILANDRTNGQIRFTRRSRTQDVGIIQMLGRGQHSDIAIKFDS